MSLTDLVGQQLGNHRLTRLLGKGGFADVYLGQHVYLHSYAAVKVLRTILSTKQEQAFLAEAQTLARLTHPHIVRIIDFAVANETPFLVMDYLPNGTLRQQHPRGTQVPLDVVLSYVNPIASALQYAHNQRIVHRDIKPDNMLLGAHNEVILTDFGIAAVAHDTESMSVQDEAGTIVYMSPEHIRGKPRPASDQYSLGVVIYEWLTGFPPFQGKGTYELYHQHLSEPPCPLREKASWIPAAVDDVVMKALAKNWQERFPSVRDFAIALGQATATPDKPYVIPSLLSSSFSDFPPLPPLVPPHVNEELNISSPVPVLPETSRISRAPLFRRLSRRKSLFILGLILVVIIASVGAFSPAIITSIFYSSNQGTFSDNTSMFGFDPGHSRFNSAENILSQSNAAQLTPGWNALTGGGKIISSPTIAKKVVYVGSWDGKVYAYKANGCGGGGSCSPLWTSEPTGSHIESSPAVANNLVYVGSWDGKLYTYKADSCGQATCTALWSSEPTQGKVNSSPTIANGIVYIGSQDHRLYAYKANGCGKATCAPLWVSEPTGDGIYSSPAVADGIVYIGSQDHRLYAYKADGCGKAICAPLWESKLTGDRIYSSPAVAGGIVYVGSLDHKLYAYKATGCNQTFCSPLWVSEAVGDLIYSSPAVANGVVYIASQDRHLYAYKADGCDKTVCAPLWISDPAGGKIFSSPTVANGVVYIASEDRKLYAYAASGCSKPVCSPLWISNALTGDIDSSPLVAYGVIYVGTMDGFLYTFHLPQGIS